MEPFKSLANGIVKQAVKDWRSARKCLLNNPKKKKKNDAMKTIEDTESFFLSEWFDLLTDVDGEALLSLLRKEFAHDG